ncbi:MAG: hypothetical protein IPP73_00985 [Chitinophagaceae bacterium]|nr:hypothetical protein [Chitinophagaceae bacterium]
MEIYRYAVRWGLFHPDTDTKAYIATATGVWETDLLNGASTVWSANASFPNVSTDMIKSASDRLIAAPPWQGNLDNQYTWSMRDSLCIKCIWSFYNMQWRFCESGCNSNWRTITFYRCV